MIESTAAIPSAGAYPDRQDLGNGAFALFAPAKINLSLKILGKRPDGFHNLDTLFQEISLADLLEFHPSPSWDLEIRQAPDLDAGPTNLVTRAARLLSQAAGIPCQARVVLHKQIPTGGGLGGGSADAAVALIGLSELWGLNWPLERLHGLAAALGSDCAFFLYGGLARGTGRGEVLDLLEDRFAGNVVLVLPPYGVSTAWAYSQGDFPLTGDEKSVILEFSSPEGPSSVRVRKSACNDLEKIVLSKYSELAEIKQRLLDLGARLALLSGSGSTVFGIFEEHARALHAAQQFGPPLQVRVCRTVKRPRRSDARGSNASGLYL